MRLTISRARYHWTSSALSTATGLVRLHLLFLRPVLSNAI